MSAWRPALGLAAHTGRNRLRGGRAASALTEMACSDGPVLVGTGLTSAVQLLVAQRLGA